MKQQDKYRVETYQHPSEMPEDVRQLFSMAEHCSVDLGYDWYVTLANTVFGSDAGLAIHVLRRDGRPVAALPLRVQPQRFGKHLTALGNYYTTLYTPILASDSGVEELARLLKAVRTKVASLATIRLEPMPLDSAVFEQTHEALRRAGLRPFRFFCFGNWHLPADMPWATYLEGRPRSLRNNIRSYGKKFAAAGGQQEIVQAGEKLGAALDAYHQIYAKSWKVSEPYPEFVSQLARYCAAHGWLRLGIAWLDSKPVAAQLWIVAHGKAYIYKVAYDEDFKQYAPGTVLTAFLMQHVLDVDKATDVDYLIGDDAYKKNWMTHRRERWGLVAYNPLNPRGLAGLAREVAGRAFKAWRQKK